MAILLPNNSVTVFVFDLPYAIPAPDGKYEIKVRDRTGTLILIRVQKEQVAGFKGQANIQIKFDKYGKSSFSKIRLTLPWVVDFEQKGRQPVLLGAIPPRDKAKEIVIQFLNRFIETVRYVTGEYWVEPARYQDLLAYEAFYWDGVKKYPAQLTLIDTGVGGIGIGRSHPFHLSEEKSAQLADLLRNGTELDSSSIFILNAKDACLQEDFRLATVEAVTALEIVLYSFIRKQGDKLGISRRILNNFIKEVGLTGNINVVLKMLTKGLKQIEANIEATCKGAITTRNNILHEGFRDIPSTDTENRVIAIEKMLDYLRGLINEP